MDLKTEMFQATPEISAYVNGVAQEFIKFGKGNIAASMSLAISLAAQVFLLNGGNIEKAEMIADMVREGMKLTLKAYQDEQRITHQTDGRLKN